MLFFCACLLLSACEAPAISANAATVTSSPSETIAASSQPEQNSSSDTIPNPDEAILKILHDVMGDSEQSPDENQRETIAKKLGELGYPVLMRYTQNMLNYEIMAKFCEDASAGRDSEATLFYYPWNGITSHTFCYKDGKMSDYFTNYSSEGAKSDTPGIIDSFTYTEKGNFMYYSKPTETLSETQDGFRVLPLSEESWELYRKYVAPGDFYTQGLLNGTWNSKDFSAINWEWEFEGLWMHTTGKEMVDRDSPYYVEAPDKMSMDRVKLPAGVVEGLLQKYFDVPTETLRLLNTYDSKTDTYNFKGFRGGGYSPTIEVSKWRENPDGSMTLWIDFVSLEFGQELSAQSILTVMPMKDGSFKYLSNILTADGLYGYQRLYEFKDILPENPDAMKEVIPLLQTGRRFPVANLDYQQQNGTLQVDFGINLTERGKHSM